MLSSLRSITIACVLSLSLAACGFRPVYEDYGIEVGGGADRELAAVDIGDISTLIDERRVEQMLRTNLEKELDPLALGAQKKYRLDVSLTSGTESLGVKKSAEVTRYKLTYNAEYKLINIGTGKAVKKGKSRIVGGYDAVASDFGTYAAQKDTEVRVIQEVAKDIKLKLTSFFLNKE